MVVGRQAPTVLVVDDEEAFHLTVARYLRAYRVVSAYNGRQAFDALRRAAIDVALLDLNLPDTNGLEILRRLREEHSATAVIVVSAHDSSENIVASMRGGARDFLPKSHEAYQRIDEVIDAAVGSGRHEAIPSDEMPAWIDSLERVVAIVGPLVTEALGSIEDPGRRALLEAHVRSLVTRARTRPPRLGTGVSHSTAAAEELCRLMVDLALAARGPRAAARRLGISYASLKSRRRRGDGS